jgi:hypothetical protein
MIVPADIAALAGLYDRYANAPKLACEIKRIRLGLSYADID